MGIYDQRCKGCGSFKDGYWYRPQAEIDVALKEAERLTGVMQNCFDCRLQCGTRDRICQEKLRNGGKMLTKEELRPVRDSLVKGVHLWSYEGRKKGLLKSIYVKKLCRQVSKHKSFPKDSLPKMPTILVYSGPHYKQKLQCSKKRSRNGRPPVVPTSNDEIPWKHLVDITPRPENQRLPQDKIDTMVESLKKTCDFLKLVGEYTWPDMVRIIAAVDNIDQNTQQQFVKAQVMLQDNIRSTAVVAGVELQKRRSSVPNTSRSRKKALISPGQLNQMRLYADYNLSDIEIVAQNGGRLEKFLSQDTWFAVLTAHKWVAKVMENTGYLLELGHEWPKDEEKTPVDPSKSQTGIDQEDSAT